MCCKNFPIILYNFYFGLVVGHITQVKGIWSVQKLSLFCSSPLWNVIMEVGVATQLWQ